jgi:hypothetical protein
MLRRESMKPDMKDEYTHLCSHNLKFTDITDCSKISNKISGGLRGRFMRG